MEVNIHFLTPAALPLGTYLTMSIEQIARWAMDSVRKFCVIKKSPTPVGKGAAAVSARSGTTLPI